MRIEAVYLRRFRGLEKASLSNCAGMNVLIGRNNAGKSSVLHAIETGLSHISSGRIAKIWQTRTQPADEFTHRETSQPIQIGLSFQLDLETNEELRQWIVSSGAGLEVAVNQLESACIASVICEAMLIRQQAVLYVRQIGLSPIDDSGTDLTIQSNQIFSISENAAEKFAEREQVIARKRSDIRAIDRLDKAMIDYAFRDARASSKARILREVGMGSNGSPELHARIEEIVTGIDSSENFVSAMAKLKASFEIDIEEVEKSPIDEGMKVFSGTVRVIPAYVEWFLKKLSEGKVLSFKEIRDAIGRDEANQILKLKTKRGGAEALARVQGTVKSLLGVRVDAFEPESAAVGRRGSSDVQAEMDVDEFLVEANGAGIREALRIILDLELKDPCLAFIEEPEVHLHPGLERVLHRYLASKSTNIQLFIATHSANFLDASTRQNVYLVSRSEGKTSEVQKVASESDLLKIAEEVGLRPSTVLMFDRLVFVEGPSDEEILLELSKKLNIDIAASNTAFVQMGGASKFAHYAAQATLDLLSRRQIKMWFVIDKDEKSDAEITKLIEKLGSRAELTFLNRREIENYLLFPEAIRDVLLEKIATSGTAHQPNLQEIEASIASCAQALLERAIELRVSRTALKPVYAQYGGNSTSDRLVAMRDELSSRMSGLEALQTSIRIDLSKDWEKYADRLAPGSEILDAVFSQFGHRYRKESDGRRLAERVDVAKLDNEIVRFLRKIAALS